MKLFTLSHSYAAFRMFYAFLNKVKKRTVIILNILFIFLYSYYIYLNVNNIYLLAFYSTILGISVVITVLTIIIEFSNFKKCDIAKIEKISKIFNYIKYVARLLVIIFGFVSYFCFAKDENEYLITNFISAILYLIQVVLFFTIYFLKKYVHIFEVALKKDLEESFVSVMANPKKAFINKISKLSDKMEGDSSISKEDQEIIKILDSEIENHKAFKKASLDKTLAFEIGRIKIVFKNKIEEEKINREANRLFFKKKKKAEKEILKNHNYELTLEKYVLHSEDINASDNKIKNFIKSISYLASSFLSKTVEISGESLILIVSFASVYLSFIKSLGTKELKILSCIINILISDAELKKMIESI